MVALATGWLEETPDKATKVALLTALLEVTDGKIYVEAERYVGHSDVGQSVVSATGLNQNLATTTATPITTTPTTPLPNRLPRRCPRPRPRAHIRVHTRARAHARTRAIAIARVPL